MPAWLDKILGKAKDPEFQEKAKTAARNFQEKRTHATNPGNVGRNWGTGSGMAGGYAAGSMYPATDIDGDGIPDNMDVNPWDNPYDNMGGNYNATDDYGDGEQTGQEPVDEGQYDVPDDTTDDFGGGDFDSGSSDFDSGSSDYDSGSSYDSGSYDSGSSDSGSW